MTRSTLPRTIVTAAALTAIALPLAGITANLADAATAPSARAAQEVRVTPTGFDRGADAEVPVLRGDTIHDGTTTVSVPGTATMFLGTSGASYLVQTRIDGEYRLLRLTPGGDPVDLGRLANAAEVRAASDGSVVFSSVYRNRADRSIITAIDAVTGETVARRSFDRYAYALDGTADLALVSAAKGSRTLEWTFEGDTVRTVSGDQGYYASIATNTLASFTGDPFDGGCTRVSPVDRPGQTLWRDCDAAVISSAPGGRTATVFILSDGPGPSAVTVRGVKGRSLTTYTAPRGGLVSTAGWEDAGSVVLAVTGRKGKGALVRCDGADCERASDLYDSTVG